jgi:hypothetical protein
MRGSEMHGRAPLRESGPMTVDPRSPDFDAADLLEFEATD